jgi:hypothetical protein
LISEARSFNLSDVGPNATEEVPMRILTGLIVLLAAGASASVSMAQPKATDSQFIQASRCAGLASSSNLGAVDAGYDGWLKQNASGRPDFITERAASARRTAQTQANKARGLEKQQLTSELGSCSVFRG